MTDQVTIHQSPIVAMMEKVDLSTLSPDGVAAFSKMLELHEKYEAKAAEKAFSVAFCKLQSDIGKITANKTVPTKTGQVKYKYAAYDEIMEAVRPALTANDFSISFGTEFIGEGKDLRAISTCKLRHKDGHSECNSFAARVGSGPPDASMAQADGAAATYAQRFALCKMLNIVVEEDDDAAASGGGSAKITAQEAKDLEAKVNATGANVVKFLAWLKAETFESIAASRLQEAHRQLNKVAAQKKEAQ